MKNNLMTIMLIVTTLFTQSSFAQNLVPNPSFEDTVMCPDMGGQVARARYWHTLDNTPDYFHECCVYTQNSIPCNYFGCQYAATGEAYCGLYTINAVSNWREIIGAFLLTPLTIGTKYYVTFKLNFTDINQGPSHAATNKTGILFSTADYLTSPPPLNNFAQVYSQNIISDTTNWTTVRGSFIADSNYSFISIGNFFDDTQTDVLLLDGATIAQGYYFVDDVCVSTDSLFSELWFSIPDEILGENLVVYPNPGVNKIIIENIAFDCTQIEMYDVSGKQLQTISTNRNDKITIDISSFTDGIYSLLFKNGKSITVKEFVKSNN